MIKISNLFLRRRGGLDLAKVKIASEALHQVKNCEVNSWILSGVDAVKKFSDTQVLGKKGTINWPFQRVQYIFSNLPICTLCNSSFLTEMKSFVAECWNHSFYSKLRHFQIRGDGDWRAHVRRVPMEKQFSTRLRNWRRTHKKRRLDLWLCQLMKFLNWVILTRSYLHIAYLPVKRVSWEFHHARKLETKPEKHIKGQSHQCRRYMFTKL